MTSIQPFLSKSAWTVQSMADQDTWIYGVSESGIAELDAALRAVLARGLQVLEVQAGSPFLTSGAARPLLS